MNKEKTIEQKNTLFEKNKVKHDRVSDYLGSSGLKATFNYQEKNPPKVDKITNTNEAFIVNSINEDKNKKFRVNQCHIFYGNKGFYKK